MKYLGIVSFAFFAMSVSPAKVYAAEPIDVWSDPSARYTVLEVTKKSKRVVHIVTKRVGKSGTSFSKREIDCKLYRFRYLGGGDTLAEMQSSKENPKFGGLVEGSISEIISNYACKTAGLR